MIIRMAVFEGMCDRLLQTTTEVYWIRCQQLRANSFPDSHLRNAGMLNMKQISMRVTKINLNQLNPMMTPVVCT